MSEIKKDIIKLAKRPYCFEHSIASHLPLFLPIPNIV